MNLLKKIRLPVILILVFTALIIGVLTKSVAPSAIKDLISKQLNTLTTQNSHIDGEITWHLFPRPGIKVTQIHVGEKTNYSIYIENLLLNAQLAPLLQGHLVFNELEIDGLKININPEAQTNLTSNKTSGTSSFDQSNAPAQISTQCPLNRFLLTRGQVTIIQPNHKIVLTNVQIGAKQLNLKNKFFPLQFKATLASSIAENKLKASINYKGRIRLTSTTLNHPLMVLKHAIIDGQLLAQNVRFNQLKIDKINANVKSKQDAVLFNPLNLTLYSGESVGDLNYQFSSQKLSFNQTATSLAANQLFNDLVANSPIKGYLDFSIHASTNLQDTHWQKNLRGNGNLTIKDGILYVVDLNTLIDQTTKKIHSLFYQDKKDIKQAIAQPLFNATTYPKGTTKFQLVSIQYHILDNKLTNDSLFLQTDKLQLKGDGQINLTDMTQKFTLLAKLISNDNLVNKIQQLLGGSFPLNVEGTLTNPQISPNSQELNPIISTYLLKNTLEMPIQQITSQLKDLLTAPDDLFQEPRDKR
jgi:AsmA protein